ncbi:MAG: 30S ribosomal protein S7 [Legionellales bacterium]|nr:MAG: 30S ribosomal protein S7 [Legionellales bacterium]
MSRKNAAVKRVILPDSKYGDVIVAKFINYVMKDGKKAVAINVVYKAFAVVTERRKEEPLKVFSRALYNVSPMVEVRSKRVGGATYQVPMPVAADRARALAFGWIIDAAQKRGERDMFNKLAGELMDAAGEPISDEEGSEGRGGKGGKGGAVKKREDTHRMAEANKAFSHFSGR